MTSEELKQFMADNGLNQSDVSRSLGIAPASVSQWMSGKTRMSFENDFRLRQMYDHKPQNDKRAEAIALLKIAIKLLED